MILMGPHKIETRFFMGTVFALLDLRGKMLAAAFGELVCILFTAAAFGELVVTFDANIGGAAI